MDKGRKVGFMYINFFQLLEMPFSRTPSSKFNYFSENHINALNYLIASMNDKDGLAILTGEVGTGKSTMMQVLTEGLPTNCQLAMILEPNLSVLEFMQALCAKYAISYQEHDSYETLFRLVVAKLQNNFEQKQTSVLIIDDAHLLHDDVLEQIYLFNHVEINGQILLKTILIGHSELLFSIRRTNLQFLAQEFRSPCHLNPLNREETGKYISHRLHCAGRVEALFNRAAIKVIARESGGVARMINLICDQALKIAYYEKKNLVDRKIAIQACRVLMDWRNSNIDRQNQLMQYAPFMAIALAVMVGGLTSYIAFHLLSVPEPSIAQHNPSVISNHAVHQNRLPSSNAVNDAAFTQSSISHDEIIDEFLNTPEAPIYLNDTLIVGDSSLDHVEFEDELYQLDSPDDLILIEEEQTTKPNSNHIESVTETTQLTDKASEQMPKPNETPLTSEANLTYQTTKVMFPSQRIDRENVSSFFNLLLDESDALMLVKNWWQDFDLGDGNCASLLHQTPSCVKAKFSLSQLLRLDYPAILEITKTDGSKGYAVFYAAENNQAKLLVDNMRFVMDMDYLEELWQGNAQLIWLPPEINKRDLFYGAENASVAWLDSKMRDYFKDNSAPSAYFDDMLLKKVKLFQRKHQLAVDGIPGTMTLLTLTGQLDESKQPLLKTVDDSPWENWILENRGLLESFDIITESRTQRAIAAAREENAGQAPKSFKQSQASEKSKQREWLSDLNEQGFIQLGANPNRTSASKITADKPKTANQKTPDAQVSVDSEGEVLEKVVTDQHLTMYDGQPIEIGREIVINHRNSGVSGLTSPVMLEDVDVSKLPEALAQKVLLALNAREKHRQGEKTQGMQSEQPMTTAQITKNIREHMENPSKRQMNDATESSVVNLEQLSKQLYQRLPTMNFQAHIYSSDTDRRWIRVNGNVFKEGDTIARNVLLKRIEPNRVVVQFENNAISIPALWSE